MSDTTHIGFKKCPRCDLTFQAPKRKKTKHHCIPQFMNPTVNVTMDLCLQCHAELNTYYKLTKIQPLKNRKAKNFEEFKEIYEDLRERFNANKINRGEFGEGLWTNLVNFLEVLSND